MINWLLYNWIELAGAALGILYVFLEIKENNWLWPIGIATSIFYIFVFISAKLYADMSLQFYYIGISIYGLYIWKYKKSNKNQTIKITKLSLKLAISLASITFSLVILGGFLLNKYTDASVPYWDALTTVLSIIATWMLTKKIIEQWLVWIVTNAICIGLYTYKELYLTVILFIIYFILSIIGYIKWKQTLNKELA